MVFNTGDGGERLRITADGNLAINKTSSISAKLHIGDTSNNGALSQLIKLGNDSSGAGTGSQINIGVAHGNESTSACIAGFLDSDGGTSFTVKTAGTYANQSTVGERLRINSSGHILPGASGTQNLGSTSLEWGNVYIADSKNIFFGSDQDGEIYHSGSHLYLQNGTGNLYIRGGGQSLILRGDNNKDGIIVNATTTFLYYDNAVKLTTSGTGIEVTGEVAASQDYPNIQPTLDFNFAASKKLDPRIAYTRIGPASFVNEFGKVEIVSANAPRFDHDPDTRESKGLLIEESRTNLLKYSVDFASIPGYNANYSNARSTLSSTTEVAPDGTNTASKYVRTAGQGNGEVAIIIGNTLGLSNGTVYTSSIFVKNVGTSGIVEFVNVRASDANDDSQFNLANGTITTDGSNNSLTTITP